MEDYPTFRSVAILERIRESGERGYKAMEQNSLQKVEAEQLPTTTDKDVRRLTEHVYELEEEVRELKKDLHAIDLFQKKPIISSDALAIGGFWIVAAITVIGIFY